MESRPPDTATTTRGIVSRAASTAAMTAGAALSPCPEGTRAVTLALAEIGLPLASRCLYISRSLSPRGTLWRRKDRWQ